MAPGISSGNITHPLTRSGVPLSRGWHFLCIAYDWSDLEWCLYRCLGGGTTRQSTGKGVRGRWEIV